MRSPFKERSERLPLQALRRKGAARVWAFNATLLAAGFLVYTYAVQELGPIEFNPLWPFVTAMFYFSEAYVVHIQFRRDAHSFSLNEIPLVLGLFFLNPIGLVLAQGLGALLALTLIRRQSPTKLVFNLAHFLLETCVAIAVFHWLVGALGDSGPLGWVATYTATSVTTLLGVLAVFTAISLSEGKAQFDNLRQMLPLGLVVTCTNSSLALIGVTVLVANPESVWLLLVPTATLFIAYRAYTAERERHESLEFLYDSTRILNQSKQMESAVLSLLEKTRSTFRAEIAELVLFPPTEGDAALRTSLGPGAERVVMTPVSGRSLGPGGPSKDRQNSVLMFEADAELQKALQERGVEDAMIATLRGENRPVGTLLVGNRLGDVTTFDQEDLKLFDTLATQVSVSLENGRLEKSLARLSQLEGQLRHQAYHDSLTGLTNRSLFEDRVTHALARRREQDTPAVLFVDVDDFKSVNDSMGHSAGDELLKQIAKRLVDCLRPSDTAARLGGDEFAVLLEDCPDASTATTVGDRIMEAFVEPFALLGRELTVGVSLGIALSSPTSMSSEELIRNSDVAMYRAKNSGKGHYELFEADMYEAVLKRSELKAELQLAVESEDFALHYQPCIDLATGRVSGVEALLRWQHSDRGTVLPSEFISLSEETGLISPMGSWVLREACAELKRLRMQVLGSGPFTMAVNLSARQLSEPTIVQEVAEALCHYKLEPSNLTLEITESVLMKDTEATVAKLRELKELGLRIALDDFGTGYSSLSYLRWFPIDQLKIPKSFVDGICKGDRDRDVVLAIIRLADALGLQTVAEGIEDGQQARRLAELGCDLGQGYYFSEPVGADEVVRKLRNGLRFEVPAERPSVVLLRSGA
jgi:diguanylate cyclase (GGDEF)-like protein